MDEKSKFTAFLGLILFFGFCLRLLMVPEIAFFCDVPEQIEVIESGKFTIQFPGYAPYHVLIAFLSKVAFGIHGSLMLFSLICGMATVVYAALTARYLAGNALGLTVGVMMASGLFPVYFSSMGTSYTTDMVYVAGMLYHGIRYLREDHKKQFQLAVVWQCFGLLMRPVSAVWTVMALLWLAYYKRNWVAGLGAALALGLTGVAYVGISVPFYESVSAFFKSSTCLSDALQETTSLVTRLTNCFRFIAFPLYGFQLWFALGLLLLLKNWRNLRRPEALFVMIMAVPFTLLTLRYIPHAGYCCLALPAFYILPLCVLPEKHLWQGGRLAVFTSAFVTISLIQIFLLHPIATTGKLTGVTNVYFLQYSRAGVKMQMADTLAMHLYRNNVNVDEIPKERRDSMAGRLKIMEQRLENQRKGKSQ